MKFLAFLLGVAALAVSFYLFLWLPAVEPRVSTKTVPSTQKTSSSAPAPKPGPLSTPMPVAAPAEPTTPASVAVAVPTPVASALPASPAAGESPPTSQPRPGDELSIEMQGWQATNYGDEAPQLAFGHQAKQVVSAHGGSVKWNSGLACASGYVAMMKAEGGGQVTSAMLQAALARCGYPYGPVQSRFYMSSVTNEQKVVQLIEETIAQPARRGTLLVGAARYDGAHKTGFNHTYVILSCQTHARLDPVPRRVLPNATLKLSGVLEDGLGQPKTLHMATGGDVRTVETRQGSDNAFEATISVGPTPGEHWLELIAEGTHGPEVLALLPVYVGIDPPDQFSGKLPADEKMLDTSEKLARLAWEFLNEDRARHGLPPLRWDARLAAVAFGHAGDMRDRGYFAHHSPEGRSMEDRAQDAGYACRSLGENIASNATVFEAEEGLMRSLGHRANILSKKFTHVGIGVAIEIHPNGRRQLYVTQNFSVPTP